ncbi:MAG TPA: hypothetical protein VNO50_09010 [Pyrinomonadaceae bacterium]|nr:hypothetical protein [Pyrinomonadaceae bacterium]
MTRTKATFFSANTEPSVWLRPRRLLIAAAIFHLIVTLSIFVVGRSRAFPSTFDVNGIAFPHDSDGVEAREEIMRLGATLVRGEIREWIYSPAPFHLKLFSICFALPGPLPKTILSAAPLNSLCYLAILALIFNLGQEALSRRAGLLAAATVALWPSFLMHTTQLLKDPLFLVAMLAFVIVNLRLLTRNVSWAEALGTGAVGGVIAAFIWLVRDNMGELLIATLALGVLIQLVRQVRQRQLKAANLVGMFLLIVISAGVMRVVPKSSRPFGNHRASRLPGVENASTGRLQTVPRNWSESPSTSPLSPIAAHIGKARQRFVNAYPNSGSNIDAQVQIRSIGDLLRYLPRAAAVGFFAPFPNMWFAAGNHVGSGARLLSGFETTAMFAVEALALVGLWRQRRRVSAWWLALVAAMGLVSLGLVVVNVGALYRLRYVFLILLMILAAEGAVQLWDRFTNERCDASGSPANA